MSLHSKRGQLGGVVYIVHNRLMKFALLLKPYSAFLDTLKVGDFSGVPSLPSCLGGLVGRVPACMLEITDLKAAQFFPWLL